MNGTQWCLHIGVNVVGFKRLEKNLHVDLQNNIKREEVMLFQWSHAKWLTNGGRNMHYYHTKNVSGRRHNNILLLKEDQGRWVEDSD